MNICFQNFITKARARVGVPRFPEELDRCVCELIGKMSFALFDEKCRKSGLSQAAIDAFKHNYDQLLAGETGLVRACDSEVVGTPFLSMAIWLIPSVLGELRCQRAP